jgi:hypothetical protein
MAAASSFLSDEAAVTGRARKTAVAAANPKSSGSRRMYLFHTLIRQRRALYEPHKEPKTSSFSF